MAVIPHSITKEHLRERKIRQLREEEQMQNEYYVYDGTDGGKIRNVKVTQNAPGDYRVPGRYAYHEGVQTDVTENLYNLDEVKAALHRMGYKTWDKGFSMGHSLGVKLGWFFGAVTGAAVVSIIWAIAGGAV